MSNLFKFNWHIVIYTLNLYDNIDQIFRTRGKSTGLRRFYEKKKNFLCGDLICLSVRPSILNRFSNFHDIP